MKREDEGERGLLNVLFLFFVFSFGTEVVDVFRYFGMVKGRMKKPPSRRLLVMHRVEVKGGEGCLRRKDDVESS